MELSLLVKEKQVRSCNALRAFRPFKPMLLLSFRVQPS